MKNIKYQGSKARIAKQLAPIINNLMQVNEIQLYIEPFVGGANLIQHIEAPHKWGFDNNEYLIAFLNAIKNGYNPLKSFVMTEEAYQRIKDNKDAYLPEIVGLAGFCATYNAKWFGGYAGNTIKTKDETFRNYYEEAVRNVLNQAKRLQNIYFAACDYRAFTIKGALIYCDPPYENTTGYKDDFDHSAYWQWVREMSKNNIVLCSEYNAPEDFVCIWSKELTTTLDKNSRSKAVEKLFVHNSIFEKVKGALQ